MKTNQSVFQRWSASLSHFRVLLQYNVPWLSFGFKSLALLPPHLFNSPTFYFRANHSRHYFIPKPKRLQKWSCQCESLSLSALVFHRWRHMELIAVFAGSGLFVWKKRFFASKSVQFAKMNTVAMFTLIKDNLYFTIHSYSVELYIF